MLYTEKLLAELERTRDSFISYQEQYGQQLDAYRAVLASLGARYGLRGAALCRRESAAAEPAGKHVGGRLPTTEYDRWRATGGEGVPVLAFGQTFPHHEAARQLGGMSSRHDDVRGRRKPATALARCLGTGSHGTGGLLRKSARTAGSSD